MTTVELFPGVNLRICQDSRFKQSCLSLQFLRPMCAQEAALNALLPTVLLRGCRRCPDLRSITQRLDELYGASVGELVRRVGDCQTVGLYCSCIQDRYAPEGAGILASAVELLGWLLLEPLTENGVFLKEHVESEKQNLLSLIDSERSDKRAYAAGQLLRRMCRGDSYGVPRLGDREAVAAITPEALFAHYQTVLAESPAEVFYVGSAQPEQVADLLRPLFAPVRQRRDPPERRPFQGGESGRWSERMDIRQARLCLGFVTDITDASPDYAAMQVLNTVFGGGMTSKLFLNVREKMGLCYSVDAGYYPAKGLVLVSAGINGRQEETVRREILEQLEQCRQGAISDQELESAKQALLSALRGVYDRPGAMEQYFGAAAILGRTPDPEREMAAIRAVTAEQAAAAAQKLQLRASFFLKEQEDHAAI